VEQGQVEAAVASPASGFLARVGGYIANGLRYWEPRRLVYNGVLAAVVLTHFSLAWPASGDKLSFDLFLGLFFLAVLANIAYCAAYLGDLFVELSGLHEAWRRGRIALLTVGTLFAATITHFFAKGLFGG
jgi:hypothetical protein